MEELCLLSLYAMEVERDSEKERSVTNDLEWVHTLYYEEGY